MAINLGDQINIDKSNLAAYPNGQIKDDDGTGDGTPINRVTSSDVYIFFDKLMRLAGLTYSGDFDNEINNYQFVQAAVALASKSDYILALTTSAGVLQIPTAIQILQLNEKLICQANFNQTTETTIKGTGASPKNITVTSPVKNGDFILLINGSTSIKLIRLATADNINQLVSDNAYLKAASDAETLAGSLTTKAVTPHSFLAALALLLNNNTNSAPYLATTAHNGLLSAADKTAIDNFNTPIKNTGWFSGLDPGSSGQIGTNLSPSGDVTLATVTSTESDSSTVRVTIANAMANTNYFVSMFVESTGTITLDNDLGCPVFKPFSTTQFDMSIGQPPGTTSVQNLKIHFQVVQIS